MGLSYIQSGDAITSAGINTIIDGIQNISTGHVHNGVDAKAINLAQVSLVDDFITSSSTYVGRTDATVPIVITGNRILIYVSSHWRADRTTAGEAGGVFRIVCNETGAYISLGQLSINGASANMAIGGFIGGTFMLDNLIAGAYSFTLQCKATTASNYLRNLCSTGGDKCEIIVQEI